MGELDLAASIASQNNEEIQVNHDNDPTRSDARFLLDGLKYQGFTRESEQGVNAKAMIYWLDRQERFNAQPYEYLANLYRRLGQERDAREVYIERRKRTGPNRTINSDPSEKTETRRQVNLPPGDPTWLWCLLLNLPRWLRENFFKTQQRSMNWLTWFWDALLRITIRYGYAPYRPFFVGIGVIVFGWVIFWGAHHMDNAFYPAKARWYSVDSAIETTTDESLRNNESTQKRYTSKDLNRFVSSQPSLCSERKLGIDCIVGDAIPFYPKFNSVLDSIDLFVPVLDLHQDKFWELRTGTFAIYWFYRFYSWMHIMLGWIVSTLVVVALTGIIRRD